MTEKTLRIAGMHCHHCVQTVRKLLKMIDGLEVEEVNVGSARVRYDEQKVVGKDIGIVLGKLGYTVQDE